MSLKISKLKSGRLKWEYDCEENRYLGNSYNLNLYVHLGKSFLSTCMEDPKIYAMLSPAYELDTPFCSTNLYYLMIKKHLSWIVQLQRNNYFRVYQLRVSIDRP